MRRLAVVAIVVLALLQAGCLFNKALYEERLEELPESCEKDCDECEGCEYCVEHPDNEGCEVCFGCDHCFETS
jgi:hypothetical protein